VSCPNSIGKPIGSSSLGPATPSDSIRHRNKSRAPSQNSWQRILLGRRTSSLLVNACSSCDMMLQADNSKRWKSVTGQY
jgi:hypothetical protein